MQLDLTDLARMVAEMLAPHLPGVHFYQERVEQGTQYPALFVQVRENQVKPELSGVESHVLLVRLIYRERQGEHWRNHAQMMGRALDYLLDTLVLTTRAGEPMMLRPQGRGWKVEGEELSYQFHLAIRLYRPEEGVKMGRMDYQNRPQRHGLDDVL